MISEDIVIKNSLGLHGRPANRFVKEANGFKSDIKIIKGNVEYNAKSVVKVLMANILCGESISITCSGEDEKEALARLISFIKSGCGDVK